MAQDFALSVNGRPVSVTALETTPLLDVLRNQLDLKGARYGCGLEDFAQDDEGVSVQARTAASSHLRSRAVISTSA